MAIYKFDELVNYARNHSTFYKDFYKDVEEKEIDITKYPIMKQELFWEANSIANNKVLTQEFESGIVFKSGGTTGNPKYSYFTNEEWMEFTKISGKGYSQNGIKEKDRVGNLFYAGELYASFLYISFSSFYANKGINFPISGATPIEEIISIIKKTKINVLAGVPTTIIKVIDFIAKNEIKGIDIDLILYGGESFYQDQRDSIKKIYPNIKIHSILYASVDGGELGYFDSTCFQDEHRRFDETTILEIVDEETGEPITEVNQPGKLLITNLCRKLMPIIRYPAGDKAMWIEPQTAINRKFRLLGRSEEGARIGPCTLYIEDTIKVLDKFKNYFILTNFQIVIEHFENKDKATINICSLDNKNISQNLKKEIQNSFYEERHMLIESVNNGIIHPLDINFIDSDKLITNNRTGKVKRVVDKRFSV